MHADFHAFLLELVLIVFHMISLARSTASRGTFGSPLDTGSREDEFLDASHEEGVSDAELTDADVDASNMSLLADNGEGDLGSSSDSSGSPSSAGDRRQTVNNKRTRARTILASDYLRVADTDHMVGSLLFLERAF